MRIAYAFMAVFIAGVAIRGTAQVSQPSPASPPTGVITGHVFCADTQHPGRLAEVALLRKPEKVAVSARASQRACQSAYAAATSGLRKCTDPSGRKLHNS